jgi:predicted XRE-type DNA-binding protein
MAKELKVRRGSGNVFADLGFGSEEASNLALRSELMMEIERYVTREALTQRAAALRLGISQPRLNDLLRGRLAKFSLDALVALVEKTGQRVELRIRKAA